MGSPGEDHCPTALLPGPRPPQGHLSSLFISLFFSLSFLFLPCHMAYVILAPHPGTEPGPSVLKLQSPYPAHLETVRWTQT